MMTADHTDAHTRMQALLAEGLPVREVVRATGLSYHTVRNAARRMGRSLTRSHANLPSHSWKKARITNRKKEEEHHEAS